MSFRWWMSMPWWWATLCSSASPDELGESFLQLEGEYGELHYIFKGLVDVYHAVGPVDVCRCYGEGGLGLVAARRHYVGQPPLPPRPLHVVAHRPRRPLSAVTLECKA